MSKFIIVIIVVLTTSIIGAAIYRNSSPPAAGDHNMQHGLPWQVEIDNGNNRVFGITIGNSTLADAISLVDSDGELAILERYQQQGAVEYYYSYFKSGPLQGKLVLVLEADPAAIEAFKTGAASQQYLENGTKKYTLDQSQYQEVEKLTVRSITFSPTARIDKVMIEQKFGEAKAHIITGENITHLLYPEIGLDALINTKGKDLLQYVSPRSFISLQSAIEQQGKAFKQTLVK